MIGVLGVGSGEPNSPFVVALHRGLAESGYIPGQNLVIEYRWTIYVRDLPSLAAELVNRKVDVIVTTGSPYSAVAAKDATSTIPIVFEVAFDPVKYWRGPIWINMNWMIYHGLRRHGLDDLAARVRRDTLALLETFGLFEYFDSRPPAEGGAQHGLGADRFSWSAALAIDLMENPAGL